MKRGIRALALTLALLLTLGAAALAAETGAVSVTTKNGVTVTPTVEACSVTFKEDSSALTLTYQNSALENDMVLLLVLKDGADAAPTEKDILYIDQTTADADGKVSFDTVYPTSYQNGKICLISSKGTTKDVATIAVSYKLGDVNGDQDIDVGDATLILQHVVKINVLEGAQAAAADVTRDGEVDVGDATKVLQYIVKIITDFD